MPKTLTPNGDAPAATDPGWLARLSAWFSWETLGRGLLRWPGTIWFLTVLMLTPLAAWAILHYDNIDYDLIRRLPANAPSVTGTKVMQDHFPAGIAGYVTILLYLPQGDFLAEDGKEQLHMETLTDRLKKQRPVCN